MVVLVTCKNGEDQIKNEGASVATKYVDFSGAEGQITEVIGEIWQKFEHIQAFMHILVTCKNEADPIKNKCARVATTFLPF